MISGNAWISFVRDDSAEHGGMKRRFDLLDVFAILNRYE